MTALVQSIPISRPAHAWGRVVADATLYLGCYLFFSWVSSTEHFQALEINPWNPAPAFSLILLLLRGFGWAPFLFVGAIMPDIVILHLPLPVGATVMEDMAEAVIYTAAAWTMVRLLKIDIRLASLRDVVCFIGVTVVAAGVMAIAYVASFQVAGIIHAADPATLILEYWVGDMIGIMAIVPLVLTHRDILTVDRLAGLWSWEIGAQSLSIFTALSLLFFIKLPGGTHMFYALFIPVVWVAARNGLPGITVALFAIQVGVIGLAFTMGMNGADITRLQLLILALAWTGLLLGALVSERELARQSVARGEARLRTIIDMAPDGLLITDDSGRIELANRVVALLLGRSPEEIVGRRVADFIAREGTPDHPDWLARRRDGAEVPVEISTALISIGNRENSVVTLHDITARRQLEADQRQRRLAQEQVSRSSLTEELAAALAHELNQPLAAIIGYAGAGQAVLSASPAATGRAIEQMAKIAAQAERAGDIIKRLREFFRNAKIDTGPASFSDIVADVLELLDEDSVRKAIHIDVDIPHGLVGLADRLQIEQVLINLLRNGIQALVESRTPSPRIAVRASAGAEGAIEIVVSDNGPGIQPEIAEKLFVPFTTSRPSGMGLGLTISQSIVVAHGGRLWAEEGRAVGAAFHFTVPAARNGAFDVAG